MLLALFAIHFHSIDEPRQASEISYPLFDVLFLTVAALITRAEGWEGIEDFGRCHLDWLKQHGDVNLVLNVNYLDQSTVQVSCCSMRIRKVGAVLRQTMPSSGIHRRNVGPRIRMPVFS